MCICLSHPDDWSGLSPTDPSSPLLFSPTLKPDETCSNGVVGIDGANEAGQAVCCPLGCGQCGGEGCATSGRKAGLDNTDCCANGIINNQPDCADTPTAPCYISTG